MRLNRCPVNSTWWVFMQLWAYCRWWLWCCSESACLCLYLCMSLSVLLTAVTSRSNDVGYCRRENNFNAHRAQKAQDLCKVIDLWWEILDVNIGRMSRKDAQRLCWFLLDKMSSIFGETRVRDERFKKHLITRSNGGLLGGYWVQEKCNGDIYLELRHCANWLSVFIREKALGVCVLAAYTNVIFVCCQLFVYCIRYRSCLSVITPTDRVTLGLSVLSFLFDCTKKTRKFMNRFSRGVWLLDMT